MKVVNEVRTAREGLHIKRRLAVGEKNRVAADKRNVANNLALVRSPAAPAALSTKALLDARKKKVRDWPLFTSTCERSAVKTRPLPVRLTPPPTVEPVASDLFLLLRF